MAESRLEDAFRAFLTGDTLRNALDFAAFAGANGMAYDGAYEICYEGRLVCYIDTPRDDWRVWRVWTVGDFSHEVEGFPIDARTKEIAWANVLKCGNCEDVSCDPGKTEVVFGRTFTNVCNGVGGLAMRFESPNAEALACAKMLVGMARHAMERHA